MVSLGKCLRITELGSELLKAAPFWDGGESRATSLADSLTALRTALESLDGRLVLGLLGGTGVGKSTLISALAGASISQASPIRPTTSLPVVYRHESFPPVKDLAGLQVVHRLDSLRHLAIIDFPDFDSLQSAHRQTVARHLKDLDLLVWVTDPDKYADRVFYELMAGAGNFAASSQAVVLNKADQLHNQDGALDYVLASLEDRLREFGSWTGRSPWPVSALAAFENQADPAAGGLGPLRNLLAEMKEAKIRKAVELGNLEAAGRLVIDNLTAAARPELWLENLEALEKLRETYRPQAALAADAAALELRAGDFIEPLLRASKDQAGGALALLTEAWDFISRKKSALPKAPPVVWAEAPAFARHLMGSREDLALLDDRLKPVSETEVLDQSREILKNAFEANLRPGSKPGSWPLWLWPMAAAILLIWAEAGGDFSPSSLTAATLRSLAPWLIFSSVGALGLSRFIWFRVKKKLARQFEAALDQGLAGLRRLAEDYFYQPLKQAAGRSRQALDVLADLLALNKEL